MPESMINDAQEKLDELRRNEKLRKLGEILHEIEQCQDRIRELTGRLNTVDALPLCNFAIRG